MIIYAANVRMSIKMRIPPMMMSNMRMISFSHMIVCLSTLSRSHNLSTSTKFDFHSILKQPITTIVSFDMMGCYSFLLFMKIFASLSMIIPIFPRSFALPLALHTSISKQIGIKLANSDLILICFEIPITQIISKPLKNWQF